MPKPTLFIDYNKFCKWYFDEETMEDTVNTLILNGKVTMDEILKRVKYIPRKFVINQDDMIGKYKAREIDEPNEFYNLKFKGE